jgi:energy-coupling factor transporter ATP-binding protein EcfA2
MEVKRNYLPLVVKDRIIDNIVSSVIDKETGNVRYPLLDFFTEVALLRNYTDYELDEKDTVAQYDELKESGKLNTILLKIPMEETQFIKNNVEKEIEQYLENNRSLGIQFKKAVDTLLDKIPSSKELDKLIPKLSKAIAKINPDTINAINSISNGTVK